MNADLLLTRLDKLGQIAMSAQLIQALLHHRVLAGAEHRRVLAHPFATVVDIGANRGQFALAVRHWGQKTCIISFEPLPGPARTFRQLFAGDFKVTLYEAAIGPNHELRRMHISAADDSSSLLPISLLQSEIFPGTEEVALTEVRVAPLDVFIKPDELISPAMLKLDVQGFEYEALSGCESLLQYFNWVYCECSFLELYSGQKLAADVIEWLTVRGFRIKGIYNPSYDNRGRTVQADFLFERKP